MKNIKTYQAAKYSDLIERIWIVENGGEATDLMVPPSQYVSIVFPLNASRYSYNGQWIKSPQIEGLTIQTTCLHYPKDTKLIGIRFYPHGLHSFLKINGKQLINKSSELLPLLKSDPAIADSHDDELLDRIYAILDELYDRERYVKSNIVRDYYQYFRGAESMISIEEYCRLNHTNYTSLNRFFTKVIGLSPKRFERLIKFRKALCSLIDSPESLTSIGADSGYFDQAHFIREFKLFLNITPSAYQALINTADKESKVINYNFRLF